MDKSSTLDPPAPLKFKPTIRWVKPALKYFLAAAALAWVLYDVRFEKLLGHLTNINWWWVALAMVCDVLSYICQGLRWRLLLRE